MPSECIFCKIIQGEIPCAKVYEDKSSIAFLDIAPANHGHVLVVPKKHCRTLLDADSISLSALIEAAKKVAKAVVKATKAEGFNIIVNNGKVAWQLVPHLHIHVIPRFSEDKVKIGIWKTISYSPGEAEKIAEQIRKFL